MKLTVIVPAFNEEACLAPALGAIRAAAEEAGAASGADIDTRPTTTAAPSTTA